MSPARSTRTTPASSRSSAGRSKQPAQVRAEGRDDRQEGEGRHLHPHAVHRHPALQVRPQGAGRRRPGRGRGGPAARARARCSPGTGSRPARARASTSSRSTSRSRSWRRSSARSCSCRTSSRAASEKIVTQKIKYTGRQHHRPRVAAPLQAHLQAGAEAADRDAAPTTRSSPIIVPIREDRRYRSCKLQNLPETNAVIIYMMDVSGSMGDEQKEIVRIESFWIDTWLRHQYKGLETRYIIHDAVAREVDRDTFFHTRESGGTMISQRLQAVPRDHRGGLPAERAGTSTRSTSPTATTGARTTRGTASTCCRTDILPGGEPVRLRPGGEPLRLGPVHQGPARGAWATPSNVALSRDRRQGRHLPVDQGLPREGPLSACPRASRPAWPTAARTRSRATRASFGLDFFETIFEVLDYDELNMVAAYGGFPTRYPHWRCGMEYEQLSKGYEYGLQKIYEMVINNDPCYAYLLRVQRRRRPEAGDGPRLRPLRLLQEQLLVQHTNRKMMDEMANHATRVRRYMDKHRRGEGRGLHRPRLSLENLIDLHSPFIRRNPDPQAGRGRGEEPTSGWRASRSTASTCTASSTRPSSSTTQRKKVEDEKRAGEEVPRAARSATCCCSCSSTRRSSPGSATSSRSSATRPTTSPRRARPRS